MADTDLFMIKAESIAGMRSVGNRCHNAEKMSWTLAHLMEKRPRETVVLQVIADELQDYLATSASMVKEIVRQRLVVDIEEMHKDEG